MASFKQLLLQEAKRRFELQKQEAAHSNASYMAPISPSPPELITEALSRLSSEVTSSGQPLVGEGAEIIDLGCGDGRWLLAALKHFKNVHCVGYDLDTQLLAKGENDKKDYFSAAAAATTNGAEQSSQENDENEIHSSEASDCGSLHFHEKDLMLADVSNATVVIGK
jgi:ribosomal protein L11 methylase PrmA